MQKATSKYAFGNQFNQVTPSRGYITNSFDPLPPMYSRINDILMPKKRIRFSTKIKTSKENLKLPNINLKNDSETSFEEPPVRVKRYKDSIHTKASLLRYQRIMEKANLMPHQPLDTNRSVKNNKVVVSQDFEEYEIEELIDLDLNDYKHKIDENQKEFEKQADEVKTNHEEDKKVERDVISVDLNIVSDSDESDDSSEHQKQKHKKRSQKTLQQANKNNDQEGDSFNESKDELDHSMSRSVKLKFGSSLSEDGNYTMLKCYEDMLCNEIKHIYPKINSNEFSRTKTSAFIRLPRKFKPPKKEEEQSNLNFKAFSNTKDPLDDDQKVEMKKHKLRVSKQLEKAMLITDKIKQKKGFLITAAAPKSENIHNIVNAFEDWTSNWKKIFT